MTPFPEQVAVEFVAGVLTGSSLARELPTALREHQGGGAGRIQDLVAGTLRHLGTLRLVLRALAPRGIEETKLEALILVGLYQLAHSKTPHHAVVHTAVALARRMQFSKAAGFVNAVLRRFQREQDALLKQAALDPVGRWSHPTWWIGALQRQYPDRFESILGAGLMHPPMTLRVNRRRIASADYEALLATAGVDVAAIAPSNALKLQRPQPTLGLPGYSEGLVSVQDAGAQWAAHLLDLRPGQRVLDACAAPGGKTAHILELADVELIALDTDASRLADAERNLNRLGLSATTRVADARSIDAWWDRKPFDRILLDAPCSASGIVRRHPDAKWLRREEDVASFAKIQAQLLDALWRVVDRGGKLLYATCSVFAEENAETIVAFLNRTPDAIRLELTGFPEPSGQLLPEEEHDGFFYALLQKLR